MIDAFLGEGLVRETIQLTVNGVPEPQGNKSAFPIQDKTTGKIRVVMREGSSNAARDRHKAWRKAVADVARMGLSRPPIDEPVSVTIVFRMPRTADEYRTRHASQPDGDKLARSVFDSLADAGLIANDSRIFEHHVTKVYADEPGADITITLYGEDEKRDREALKAEAARRRSRRTN